MNISRMRGITERWDWDCRKII